VLVGLPSSGLHTNGFTLARRALDVANGEPPEETRRRLEERPPELGGATLSEALLATHRPYVREVRPVMDRVRGMAHITGGGYGENVPRVLPGGLTAVIDTRSWEVPGIFRLIERRGRVTAGEMYEVFNMGIGLVVMVAAEDAAAVLAAIPEAVRVGEVRPWTGRPVELLGLD
jgi:phosphoribosylformylglycinamidine cyclo-ligase